MERTEEHPRTAELRKFLDEHYQRVVGSVSMITGDRSTAEDAVQEAVVKAWRRRDEPVDRLAAWITVVASNEARSGRRRESARKRLAERLQDDARTVEAHPAATDPESFDTNLLDPELAGALTALPLRERQAVVLFYVFDLSVLDAAAAMSVSAGTVKTLLSRARSHVNAVLGDPSASATTGGAA